MSSSYLDELIIPCTLSSFVLPFIIVRVPFNFARLQFYPHDSNSIRTIPILSRQDIIALLRLDTPLPELRSIVPEHLSIGDTSRPSVLCSCRICSHPYRVILLRYSDGDYGIA